LDRKVAEIGILLKEKRDLMQEGFRKEEEI
jgi:hypothetical protein